MSFLGPSHIAWVTPDAHVIPVEYNHIFAVQVDPEHYGLHSPDVLKITKGHQIYGLMFRYGYLRFTYAGGSYYIEAHLGRRTLDTIMEVFQRNQADAGLKARVYIDLDVVDAAHNPRLSREIESTVGEILQGKLYELVEKNNPGKRAVVLRGVGYAYHS